MRKVIFSSIFVVSTFFFHSHTSAQTLMINEVSQGDSGNREYVEFVVVDNTIPYNCGNTAPPCIDIRGWIFDDNSGYHGTGGVASGAVRFSMNDLWACVPLGTIIVVYNNLDPNPLMPSDDLSMADGNCRILAPINDNALFESNPTTPGAIACSYPPTGWVPGGNWNYTVLANGGDCARIVNLAGCEVFSVCWGTNNLNTQIYFAGGATVGNSATKTVYYFNGGSPNTQANWSIGCTDIVACGVQDQTPGYANNAANQVYIGQFNNNCSPIPPIVATAAVDNDAACICNGQATASGSGSIPGYTYQWYDAAFVFIGQTTATATNLCAGTYNVIVTSLIGCSDTAQITITNTGSVSLSVNSESICAGESTTLTGTPSIGGGTFLWTPSGSTNTSITVSPVGTTNYTVDYQLGTCTESAISTVTVNPNPVINPGPNQTVCQGTNVTLTAMNGTSYVWDNGVTNGTPFTPPIGTTTYTVIGTNAIGCSGTATVNVTVNPSPTVTVNSPTICEGQNATINAVPSASGGTYSWTPGGNTSSSITVSPTGTATYTVTYTLTGCSSSAASWITVNPSPVIIAGGDLFVCEGQGVVLQAQGAVSYVWDNGITNGVGFTPPLGTSTYTVIGTDANGCTGTDIVNVYVSPTATVTVNSTSICAGQSTTLTAAPSSGGGTFSWSTGGTNGSSLTVSPSSSTSYTVTYSLNGCNASATGTVTVNPAPNINAGNDLSLCLGQTAVLTATGGTSYVWTNGITNGTTFTPPLGTISYTVTGTNANGCTSTDVVSITVSSLPTANASFTPTTGTAPLLVDFTNLSSGATSYVWNFGNGQTATTPTASNVSTTYPVGTYTILLTAIYGGCTTVWTGTIVVLEPDPSVIIVPNVFTPNNDQINDFFFIQSENLVSLEGSIINRWGNVMMEFDSINFTWDGRVHGDAALEGTYFIVYRGVGMDEKEYNGHTFFELLR